MDGVLGELRLTPDQCQALKMLGTDAIVEVGGHGILTLATMLTSTCPPKKQVS